MFSPRVLKGGPLGEMVQWADILAALYVLGHGLRVTVSLKELQRWVPREGGGGRGVRCRPGARRMETFLIPSSGCSVCLLPFCPQR